jgi:hypothetical protein
MTNELLTSFEIPYRLENPEAISEAIGKNLLNIGKGYAPMLALARTGLRLSHPPALRKARKHVRKEFYRVNEKKIREYNIEYREISNLPLIDNFPKIEAGIPWAGELVGYSNLLSVLMSSPEGVRKACRIDSATRPVMAYESVLALRKLLRFEMLSYARTKQTKHIPLEDLKRLLVANTLYLPANEDVLQALRDSTTNTSKQSLYQNALAELLFARLPRFMEGLVSVDPLMIRRKLSSKLSKLDMTARHRLSLYGYFQTDVSHGDLLPTLNRINAIAQRLTLTAQTKERIHSYIESLERGISYFRTLYRDWFLGPELTLMSKLYSPGNVMSCKISSWKTLMKTYTLVTTLEFYPTKDWMDLQKGSVSMDCSKSDLGEKQLLSPNFFNIRIFRNSKWIGNIYMLDFTRECGCIIVDRIQIPRGIRAKYIQFFDHLREGFEEIFEDVEYDMILLPLRISNHESIQKAFNQYRVKLPKKKIKLRTRLTRYFESLGHPRSFHVLCSKESSPPSSVAAES